MLAVYGYDSKRDALRDLWESGLRPWLGTPNIVSVDLPLEKKYWLRAVLGF